MLANGEDPDEMQHQINFIGAINSVSKLSEL